MSLASPVVSFKMCNIEIRSKSSLSDPVPIFSPGHGLHVDEFQQHCHAFSPNRSVPKVSSDCEEKEGGRGGGLVLEEVAL